MCRRVADIGDRFGNYYKQRTGVNSHINLESPDEVDTFVTWSQYLPLSTIGDEAADNVMESQEQGRLQAWRCSSLKIL
jgi:hypothetical protein